jgi:hypothetical protein
MGYFIHHIFGQLEMHVFFFILAMWELLSKNGVVLLVNKWGLSLVA